MKWQNGLLAILAISTQIGLFPGLTQGQEEERLVLNPPLSQVFPLDPKPEGMRLKFPVLLNSRTVVGPEDLLRFMYIDPNAGMHMRGGGGGDQGGGNTGGGHGHHHGGGDSQDDGAAAVASPRGSTSAGDASNGAAQENVGSNKDATSEIRTEVWTDASLFREALDEAADMGTTLVYSVPGKQKPQSTTIDLPDGMLLAKIENHITVLAMTDESRALQGGICPNDEIRFLEEVPSPDSLTDFARDYLRVQDQARKSGKSYSIEVWRPSESRLVTFQIGAPPSLPSLF